jgi:hypothetical protein
MGPPHRFVLGCLLALGACTAPVLRVVDAGPPGPVDVPDAGDACAQLEPLQSSPSCWEDAVVAAAGCLPSAAQTGTLSADGTTCAYASGATVTFASRVTDGNAPPDFSIANGGEPCVHVQWFSGGIVLTTAAGMTTFVEADGEASLTCADGGLVSGPMDVIAECPAMLPAVSITVVSDSDAGGVDAGFAVAAVVSGGGLEAPAELFDCRASP